MLWISLVMYNCLMLMMMLVAIILLNLLLMLKIIATGGQKIPLYVSKLSKLHHLHTYEMH
jgi:hypothetical protein